MSNKIKRIQFFANPDSYANLSAALAFWTMALLFRSNPKVAKTAREHMRNRAKLAVVHLRVSRGITQSPKLTGK